MLNIYPQMHAEGTATVVGNRVELTKLRDTLNVALAEGPGGTLASTGVEASDHRMYAIVVCCVPNEEVGALAPCYFPKLGPLETHQVEFHPHHLMSPARHDQLVFEATGRKRPT